MRKGSKRRSEKRERRREEEERERREKREERGLEGRKDKAKRGSKSKSGIMDGGCRGDLLQLHAADVVGRIYSRARYPGIYPVTT
jgi:hypothetical protein